MHEHVDGDTINDADERLFAITISADLNVLTVGLSFQELINVACKTRSLYTLGAISLKLPRLPEPPEPPEPPELLKVPKLQAPRKK